MPYIFLLNYYIYLCKSIVKNVKIDEYINTLPNLYFNTQGNVETVYEYNYDKLLCSQIWDWKTGKLMYSHCDYANAVLYQIENECKVFEENDETIPFIVKWRLANEN